MTRADHALTADELAFRFDKWVAGNCIVIERSGTEWVCCCPKCGREKLAVNVSKKAFHCFVCGFASLSPTKLVAVQLDIDLRAAEQVVASNGAQLGPIEELLDEVAARAEDQLPEGTFPLTGYLGPQQLEYCDRREFPREHLNAFGVRAVYSDHSGSRADLILTDRILFPIWTRRGTPISWVARSLDRSEYERKVKVINMPRGCKTFDHAPGCTCMHREWGLGEVPYAASSDEVILGLHWLTAGQPAIVVEGPTDVIACGPGFCATLGAKMSAAQALSLARAGVSEAILMYDGDEAGQRAVSRAIKVLQPLLPVRVALCPADLDPGKLGRVRSLEIALSSPPAGGIQGALTITGAPITDHRDNDLHPFVAPLK